MTGTLYIVATPIGNLEDITMRGARLLREADMLLAEDTRTTQKLLSHLGITRSVLPYHDFNKERQTPRILETLQSGKSVALVSDAGTPGVADPAFFLVRAARAAAIDVVPAPGPCAAIAALVCSGLPTDRFIFDNFLPVKPGRRRNQIESYVGSTRTIIVYETPHRIRKALADLEAVMPLVRIVIGRELTKMHEQFLVGTATQLLAGFNTREPRGEMVLLFHPQTVHDTTQPLQKDA